MSTGFRTAPENGVLTKLEDIEAVYQDAGGRVFLVRKKKQGKDPIGKPGKFANHEPGKVLVTDDEITETIANLERRDDVVVYPSSDPGWSYLVPKSKAKVITENAENDAPSQVLNVPKRTFDVVPQEPELVGNVDADHQSLSLPKRF